LTPLQEKMAAKLSGARFRWINEQLYTCSSEKAMELLKEDPEMYDRYHEGFRKQVEHWPQNPVDIFIEKLQDMFKARQLPHSGGKTIIADMGCGDATIASSLDRPPYSKKFVIHSFDLQKTNKYVTVSDVSKTPLADEEAHVVIFCLSLMGTNFLDFITEAWRILKQRGFLWIAEIKSRFTDTDGAQFVEALKAIGFKHIDTDDSNTHFIIFQFTKPIPRDERRGAPKLKFTDPEAYVNLQKKRETAPEGKWLLKPCLYKKR
ncbi:hypothetical protein CANCADRAFT_19455, partial [Tortispora caseinolytica NRRL Y-17796]